MVDLPLLLRLALFATGFGHGEALDRKGLWVCKLGRGGGGHG